ncbi:MAG: hypothetical protein J6S14_12835 [Clostridia bacterium]|nr:hypothetical protein [Clostridia bacterium]
MIIRAKDRLSGEIFNIVQFVKTNKTINGNHEVEAIVVNENGTIFCKPIDHLRVMDAKYRP